MSCSAPSASERCLERREPTGRVWSTWSTSEAFGFDRTLGPPAPTHRGAAICAARPKPRPQRESAVGGRSWTGENLRGRFHVDQGGSDATSRKWRNFLPPNDRDDDRATVRRIS